jgi:hypothetical protein
LAKYSKFASAGDKAALRQRLAAQPPAHDPPAGDSSPPAAN